jgi:hypothetical protein
MTNTTVKIAEHAYFVGSNAVRRANAFRLLDGSIYVSKGRTEIGAPQFAGIDQTTIEKLWDMLPKLELDTNRPTSPRFLLGYDGRKYESRVIPWTFARTPDTAKVLYIRWRNDHVNWFAPIEVCHLTDPQQLVELLPLVQLA